MSYERAFEQLAERAATTAELERLRRVKDGLGLADNDAFWSVLVALEHYRSLYERIPGEIAAAGQTALVNARQAFEAAARAEGAGAHRLLAEVVVQSSLELARRQAEAVRWRSWALVLLAIVAFGCVCAMVGRNLTEGLAALPTGRPEHRLLAAFLSLPAGWLLLVILVPLAVAWMRDGWRAVSDGRSRGERLLGWGSMILAASGLAAAGVLLARIL